MNTNTDHLTKGVALPTGIATTLGTLFVGFLAGALSGSQKGYAGLVMAPLSPPDIVFPIVWGILYAMIGLSLYFILSARSPTLGVSSARTGSIWLWVAQMVFNVAWCFAFFKFKLYVFSYVWLAMLLCLVTALIFTTFKVSQTAAILLIPYDIWLLFALYLNLMIAILN